MVKKRPALTGIAMRWIVERKLSGSFWQVLILLCVVNSIAAAIMNVIVYVLWWPEWIAIEWREMLLIPVIIACVITVPVTYVDYTLLRSLEQARANLLDQLHLDYLTKVDSRRWFEERTQAAMATPDAQGVLILLDLDRFKSVNDRFGHRAGDHLLRQVGAVLRRSARSKDCVGRLGGEEFALYLPDATLSDGADIAERLRKSVAALRPIAPDTGESFQATLSAGVAVRWTGESYSKLFTRADRALYRAKEQGRDQVVADAS